MSFETWVTFVLTSAALMLVPGPAMLFMIGLALNDGLSRALAGSGLRRGALSPKTLNVLNKCGAGAMVASGLLTASTARN